MFEAEALDEFHASDPRLAVASLVWSRSEGFVELRRVSELEFDDLADSAVDLIVENVSVGNRMRSRRELPVSFVPERNRSVQPSSRIVQFVADSLDLPAGRMSSIISTG